MMHILFFSSLVLIVFLFLSATYHRKTNTALEGLSLLAKVHRPLDHPPVTVHPLRGNRQGEPARRVQATLCQHTSYTGAFSTSSRRRNRRLPIATATSPPFPGTACPAPTESRPRPPLGRHSNALFFSIVSVVPSSFPFTPQNWEFMIPPQGIDLQKDPCRHAGPSSCSSSPSRRSTWSPLVLLPVDAAQLVSSIFSRDTSESLPDRLCCAESSSRPGSFQVGTSHASIWVPPSQHNRSTTTLALSFQHDHSSLQCGSEARYLAPWRHTGKITLFTKCVSFNVLQDRTRTCRMSNTLQDPRPRRHSTREGK